MLEITRTLISDSRKKLGLENPPVLDLPLESHRGGSVTRLSHDIHDFIASMVVSDEAGNSTSRGLGFCGGLLNLDAGAIHFAGASGSLRGSSLMGENNHSFITAISQLQTAVGILVSCEPFTPCRGMLPSTEPLSLEEVASYKKSLHTLTNLLVSAIFRVISEASVLNTFSSITTPEMVALSLDFITSLFKLISLDGIQQYHMDLSFSIANAVLAAFLAGTTEKRCDFARLHRSQHTLKSMKTYSDEVFRNVLGISSILEELVSVVESSYSTHPAVLGEFLKNENPRQNISSNCVLSLTPSLKIALKLVSSLYKDIKFILKCAYSMKIPKPLDIRETNLLKNLTNSTTSTSTALKTLHNYIQNLIVSSLADSKFNASRKHGKPITYKDSYSEYKIFLDKLLQYDLSSIMELIRGCIKAYGKGGSVSQSQNVDQISGILNSGIVTRPDDPIQEVCVTSKSARFMVGTVGELMTAYFTDKKLLISLSSDPSLPMRCTELLKDKLAEVIRDQGLSDIWTVEHAVNLLLLSDQWCKACEFIVEVGDWRKAFILAAISRVHNQIMSSRRGETIAKDSSLEDLSNFSHKLALDSILKVVGFIYEKPNRSKKHVAIPNSESSIRVSEQFISETFHMCALCQLDSVTKSSADHFLRDLVGLCTNVTTKVHPGLYLPAPPLYCLQPSITEEVSCRVQFQHVQAELVDWPFPVTILKVVSP